MFDSFFCRSFRICMNGARLSVGLLLSMTTSFGTVHDTHLPLDDGAVCVLDEVISPFHSSMEEDGLKKVDLKFIQQLLDYESPFDIELPHKKTIRILSLDGGGIRSALIQSRILMKIEERTGKSICDMFDYIGGTSAGGLVATLVSTPDSGNSKKPHLTAAEIFNSIFHESAILFKKNYFSLNGVLGPKYSSDHYVNVLKNFFGNSLMIDSVIPTSLFAYNTVTQKIESLSSMGPSIYKKVDAIAATSAAQTLFHPHVAQPKHASSDDIFTSELHTFTDGGTGANNPAILSLGHALNLYPNARYIDVISIGSGEINRPLGREHVSNANMLTWLKYLPRIISTGQHTSSHTFLDNLFNVPYLKKNCVTNIRDGGLYLRWNPTLSEENRYIDDCSPMNMNSIVQATDMYIIEHEYEFNEMCKRLLQQH